MPEGALRPRLDPATGRVEWVIEEPESTASELLASSYGDMLHDDERNKAYAGALEAAVRQFVVAHGGRRPSVLDIGTGTSLLAMMAARAGAERVVACEAFPAMAELAGQVLADNPDVAKTVTLVRQRSTDLCFSPADRANIVVSEILDTELIGEGVLETMRHALDNLAVPGANVHAVLVESDLLRSWHDLEETVAAGVRLGTGTAKCGRVVDVHADMLAGHVRLLTEPATALQFDLSSTLQPLNTTRRVKIPVVRTGRVDAVLFWWDAELDAEHTISTMPSWLRDDKVGAPQWRDHWRQAIYLLSPKSPITQGDFVRLEASHDEYAIWFDVALDSPEVPASAGKTAGMRPALDPPWSLWNPSRIWMLNDPSRRQLYEEALARAVGTLSNDECLLALGDTGYLALMAAATLVRQKTVAELGGARVIALERSPLCRRHLLKLVAQHKLSRVITVLDKEVSEINLNEDLKDCRIGALVTEPYWFSSILPWHSLQFWHARASLEAAGLLSNAVRVFPHRARLLLACISFDQLQTTEEPVGTVEGFDLSAYDRVTAPFAGRPFPCALWEYHYTALSHAETIFEIEFTSGVPVDMQGAVDIPLSQSGLWNGIVAFMEYDIDEYATVSLGPTLGAESTPGYYRPAVQFVPQAPVAQGDTVTIRASFTARDCEVRLTAELK